MHLISLAVATAALVLATTPASALATSYGVDIYMSAPTVQGTAVTTSVTSESFNLLRSGPCPASISIGSVSGNCNVESAGDYGGATADATTATPTTGGSGSNYASTAGPSMTITIDLLEPAKYLGLWWSAGTDSNVVELFDGDERVATVSTEALMDLIETGSVTNEVGGTYNTSNYYGNPRNNSLASGEPFVYLNFYGTGGASFDRIVLSGGGFEFDNIAVSDLVQTPSDGEVSVQFIPGENAPADDNQERLANTGVDGTILPWLVAAAGGFAIVAVALRRKRSIL